MQNKRMRGHHSPAQRRANRRRRCGRDVIVHVCPGNPDHSWISAFHCNDRWCLKCAHRRNRDRLRSASDFAVRSLSHSKRFKARHIILTWQPRQHTRSNVRALARAAAHFVRQLDPHWSIRSLHVSPSGFLHVHIIAATPPLSKSHLQSLWRKITGHSFVVRIRTSRKPVSVKRLVNYIGRTRHAALPTITEDLERSLAGTRTLTTTGRLRAPGRKPRSRSHQHVAGCPCCGTTTRSQLLRIQQPISAELVESFIHAFPDRTRTTAALEQLRCRDPDLFSIEGAAALTYHSERHLNKHWNEGRLKQRTRPRAVKVKVLRSARRPDAWLPHTHTFNPALGGPEEPLP